MNPRFLPLIPTLVLLVISCRTCLAGDYTLVVEGFDWGPSANKVILPLEATVDRVEASDFAVVASRATDLMELDPAQAQGERPVIHAYVSDSEGKRLDSGQWATLVLFVSPEHGIGSPMQYLPGARNQWIDYKLSIAQRSTGNKWTKETRRIRPLVDAFDLDGRYTHNDGTTLSYALYTPEIGRDPHPLIIWLHGGGEGGTDPSIVLMANRAANYASPEIQTLFGGAYVLAPQTPTRWMHGVSGGATWGQEDDIYHPSLMGLFEDLLKQHPAIDSRRIYIGGCSNGGYMSLKLLIRSPGFFAGAFISALAYQAEYLTDEELHTITETPLWFVHTAHDETTPASLTALPLYKRLIEAGASKIHLSLYDHVVDITGLFGGEGYRYNDHFSWIYHHANLCRHDFDGQPVLLDDRPVTIMEWLAAQRLP